MPLHNICYFFLPYCHKQQQKQAGAVVADEEMRWRDGEMRDRAEQQVETEHTSLAQRLRPTPPQNIAELFAVKNR